MERFHSRDQQPCCITETKESIFIKIEFISLRISLVHHHGHHCFVLEHQHGRVTSRENALLETNCLNCPGKCEDHFSPSEIET